MRNYEMVFILSPELDEEKLGATVEKVTNLINNNGGEVVKQDNWGKSISPTKSRIGMKVIIIWLNLRVLLRQPKN